LVAEVNSTNWRAVGGKMDLAVQAKGLSSAPSRLAPQESMPAAAQPVAPSTGLGFWMHRVLEECDRVSAQFAPDPVHDLRVALRRCRSLADGLMAMDPDPGWKRMKKSGKRLFQALGSLRDLHVMEEWVGRLAAPGDPATVRLLQGFAVRVAGLKEQSAQALQAFDGKQWRRWSNVLPRRAARVRPGSLLFRHLALERWTDAYALHGRALRNHSQVSWHQLRIAIKRFRYVVENFLPAQHAAWSQDLKEMQDLLGEVHDLDILWAVVREASPFSDADAEIRWRTVIRGERELRIKKYRARMLGKMNLWQVWRAELPHGKEIEEAGQRRLRLWASFLDPDWRHSSHVTRLALQLYDGFAPTGKARRGTEGDPREILRLAALLHDVGMSSHEKRHHKATYRLIRGLASPVGIPSHDLEVAAAVARYHRGALPRTGQKVLRSLSPEQQREVQRLAGILRLANAFDASRDGRIRRVEVHRHNGFFVVGAEGYSARDGQAETIASGRHLLEVLLRRPLLIRPLRAKPRQSIESKTKQLKAKS